MYGMIATPVIPSITERHDSILVVLLCYVPVDLGAAG